MTMKITYDEVFTAHVISKMYFIMYDEFRTDFLQLLGMMVTDTIFCSHYDKTVDKIQWRIINKNRTLKKFIQGSKPIKL